MPGNPELLACTCGEIAGENPNCPRHGGEVDIPFLSEAAAILRDRHPALAGEVEKAIFTLNARATPALPEERGKLVTPGSIGGRVRRVTGKVAVTSEPASLPSEPEELARDWLDRKYSDVEAGHDPNDRDYGTDDMVDAFIAGLAARRVAPLPDEEAVELVATALERERDVINTEGYVDYDEREVSRRLARSALASIPSPDGLSKSRTAFFDAVRKYGPGGEYVQVRIWPDGDWEVRDPESLTSPSPDGLREALKPFAEVGQWLFARDLPDDTPLVDVKGINGSHGALTRGHFKAAHLALNPEFAALRASPNGKTEEAGYRVADLNALIHRTCAALLPGCVAVPIEPTEAELTKIARAIGATPAKLGGPVGARVYDVDLANAAKAARKAMLAASPNPPGGIDQDEANG